MKLAKPSIHRLDFKGTAQIFELLFVVGALAFALIIRFVNLRTIPDWFQDEGEFIRLAEHLSRGNFDFVGIRGSMLIIGRPPLFFWIIAGLFKLFGTDIVVLRGFTAVCGVLAAGISYIISRQTLNKTAAKYTVLLMAILPEYIFYNRLGYTYNLFAVLILLFIFAVWKYIENKEQKWLIMACLTSGLAIACDYLGLVTVVILALVILLRKPADLWKLIIIAPLPLIFVMLPGIIHAPNETWQDLRAVISWGDGIAQNFWANLLTIISAYGFLIQRQPWIVLGFIGMLTLPNHRLRNLLFVMTCGLFLPPALGRAVAAHYLLPIWPIIFICLGSLFDSGVKHMFEISLNAFSNVKPLEQQMTLGRYTISLSTIFARLTVFSLIISPFVWMILLDSGFFTWKSVEQANIMPITFFVEGYVPAEDAQAVSEVISMDLESEDFVIAPGTIYWMLTSRVADIRLVALYEAGGKIVNMPEIDPARFTTAMYLRSAKYAVVDNTWRLWWAEDYAEIENLLQQVSQWPAIMERGSLELFCNPIYCNNR
ncbi:MAG TPA: glycosyltransferase family 39 protein [Anaerolineales bacterium]|nr:glycosyltransferase family 39 protein [Anaerolineales bacterium]